MTSGEAVKYKSSAHAFAEIVKKEGTKSLFKGAGMFHPSPHTLFSHITTVTSLHHHALITPLMRLFQVPTSSVPSQELVCSLDMTNFNSSCSERLTAAVVDNFLFECITVKREETTLCIPSLSSLALSLVLVIDMQSLFIYPCHYFAHEKAARTGLRDDRYKPKNFGAQIWPENFRAIFGIQKLCVVEQSA